MIQSISTSTDAASKGRLGGSLGVEHDSPGCRPRTARRDSSTSSRRRTPAAGPGFQRPDFRTHRPATLDRRDPVTLVHALGKKGGAVRWKGGGRRPIRRLDSVPLQRRPVLREERRPLAGPRRRGQDLASRPPRRADQEGRADASVAVRLDDVDVGDVKPLSRGDEIDVEPADRSTAAEGAKSVTAIRLGGADEAKDDLVLHLGDGLGLVESPQEAADRPKPARRPQHGRRRDANQVSVVRPTSLPPGRWRPTAGNGGANRRDSVNGCRFNRLRQWAGGRPPEGSCKPHDGACKTHEPGRTSDPMPLRARPAVTRRRRRSDASPSAGRTPTGRSR